MKLVDIHAHLDSEDLGYFLVSHDKSRLSIVSNSVSVESSARNLDLSKKFSSVIPFVGIHPEIFRTSRNELSKEDLDNMVEQLSNLTSFAKGIGEIGIDPGYGRTEDQIYLFDRILTVAEKTRLPITLHTRDATSNVLEILSTHRLKSKILFHWFAGTETELRRIQAAGMYTSFGPSILFSKRMQSLVKSSISELVLSETDSPTRFRSLLDAPSSPTMVVSVVFQMGSLFRLPFDRTCELVYSNSNSYLAT